MNFFRFILAIFAMPKQDQCSFQERITLPITVICDNIRDPGNMGTVIRTCAAVGCDRLLAMKGCVDIWDPKVIRSGMGGHFRLPIINDIGWELVQKHIPENSKVYLADNKYSFDEKPLDDNNRKIFKLLYFFMNSVALFFQHRKKCLKKCLKKENK